jgi:hypothetical protein
MGSHYKQSRNAQLPVLDGCKRREDKVIITSVTFFGFRQDAIGVSESDRIVLIHGTTMGDGTTGLPSPIKKKICLQ